MSIDEVVAQVFVFFLGGFETSAAVSSYALFELAKNKDIQHRVQQEINETLNKHDNQWTYECIQDMKYLNQIFEETLRKYPPVPFLIRQATQKYKIPESNVVLDKGTVITINLYALQRNPKHYADPMKFDPERFTPENKAKITPYTYLPFGDGPRNCIGMRYGQLQSKIGLAMILSKLEFDLAPETSPDVKLNTFTMTAIGGLNLLVTRR